jgi:hypothetical protein
MEYGAIIAFAILKIKKGIRLYIHSSVQPLLGVPRDVRAIP